MAGHDTDALVQRLLQGNTRFLEKIKGDEARRAELAAGQSPFAIILACADSRVAPELVFDTGLGELFVVRVAGNVANTSSIASIEYAVAHLGARLIIVMAHESCGAVAAALEGGDAGKNLNHLLEHIGPALPASGHGDVNATAKRNAHVSATRLTAESEILRNAVAEVGLKIIPAFYHFSNGAVEFDTGSAWSGS